jgi:hypothetical protein
MDDLFVVQIKRLHHNNPWLKQVQYTSKGLRTRIEGGNRENQVRDENTQTQNTVRETQVCSVLKKDQKKR